jgi:hypothetical protein
VPSSFRIPPACTIRQRFRLQTEARHLLEMAKSTTRKRLYGCEWDVKLAQYQHSIFLLFEDRSALRVLLLTKRRPPVVAPFIGIREHPWRKKGVAVWAAVHRRSGYISHIEQTYGCTERLILTGDIQYGSERVMIAKSPSVSIFEKEQVCQTESTLYCSLNRSRSIVRL